MTEIVASNVDVLVDLMGFTVGGRPELFAARPAPVQVAYMGYPGTTGTTYIDYVLCDAVACPLELADG